MLRHFPLIALGAVVLVLAGPMAGGARGEDFGRYVRTCPDFRPQFRPNGIECFGRWDRWILMPWRYRWGRPYDDELAAALKQAGFNGGVCDFTPRSDADLHEKYGLLWYLDHAAGKGDLHLSERYNTPAYRAAYNRPRCLLDPDLRGRLHNRLEQSIRQCLKYDKRVAYALDDEISWSTMVNPCRWDNHPLTIRGFRTWLLQRYDSRGAILRQWGKDTDRFLHRLATPDEFQHFYRLPVSQWNLSPWCDALSYMDSQLLDLIGELIGHANAIDPATPAGLVGAQGASPYGGYDYAKLMRRVQFLEVYDVGASMEIARSLNVDTQMPLVTSGAGDPEGPDGSWRNWHGMIHGYRGSIMFADEWFTPGNDMRRLGTGVGKLAKVSRKLIGAKWRHDGVALYYSHPSVQVGWFMDCHVHGRTWIKRLSLMNNRLASSHAAFWAWTRLLEDARVQYNFVSYAEVAARGLDPSEYKVLILPRVLALSDTEVQQIAEYADRGGVVIADHMVGLFDQHGRGRSVPALDSLLGIRDHPPVTAGNVFGGRWLTEFDAETDWQGTFIEAASEIWPRCVRVRGLPVAERRLSTFIAARHGRGWLMLMNASLAEYCLHRRRRSPQAAKVRQIVAELLRRAGVEPWMTLSVDGTETPCTEATYWQRGGRLYICVASNPLRIGAMLPKGDAVKQGIKSLTIQFNRPQRGVFDEIASASLGDGRAFTVSWKTDEAAIISMVADPDKERKGRNDGAASRPK